MALTGGGRIIPADIKVATELVSRLAIAIEFDQQDLYDAILDFIEEETAASGKAIGGLVKALAILAAEQSREATPYDPEQYDDHKKYTGTPYDDIPRREDKPRPETEFGLDG